MHLQRNGMGDLVAGWYPVPQSPFNNPNNSLSNPIMNAVVSAKVAGRAKGVGDLVTGNYPVPQNPIMSAVSSAQLPKVMMADTSNALATSVASMQTGPTQSLSGFGLSTMANVMGMRGMGQSTSDELSTL